MQKFFRRLYYQDKPILQLNPAQVAALSAFKAKINCREYQMEKVICLCGRDNSDLVARRDRYGLPVNTHLCRHCGTMWTSPRLVEQSLSLFYEQDYRSIYIGHAQGPDAFFEQQVKIGRSVYDYIASEVDTEFTSPSRVFDIGCGAGGMLIPFQQQGWQVAGCDLGSEYLERGREVGLTLEQGGPSILQQHGCADLVILSHVLEHLPNPKQSLEEISGLLIDGGYLYIELPGIFNIHRTYKDPLRFLQNAHFYHFTLSTLSTLLADAGYHLVKGDEQIRALFCKEAVVEPVVVSNQYRKISIYLQLMNILHFIRMPFRQVKRQLQRRLMPVLLQKSQ